MSLLALAVIAFIIGQVLFVVGPYLMERLNDPNLNFDWRFFVSKSIGALVATLPVITQPEFMTTLTDLLTQYNSPILYLLAVALMGSGMVLGRYVDKYGVQRLLKKD